MATPISLNAILKVIQEDGTDPKALVRKSVLMQSIPHKEDFQGEQILWSVAYAGLAGGSWDAPTAEANDQNVRVAKFTTGNAKSYYSRRTLNGVLCRQALRGDVSEQFIDYLKTERDLGSSVVGTTLARIAYRSNTASFGQVGSVSGATMVLATKSDIFYTYVGDKIGVSATDGGALRASGATVNVIALDPQSGTITADANWSTLSAAAGDYAVKAGDQNKAMHGLQAYNPRVAPTTGDSVFGAGVDRSIDTEMLAGVRFNSAGYNIDTFLIRFMAYMMLRPGWDATGAKIFANGMDIANLKVAKEGQRFIDDNNQYEMGIEGFKVGGALLVEDPFAPEGYAQLIGDGAFELHTNNGVTLDSADGNEIRKGAGDTYALMCLVDGDFVAPKPYCLGNAAFPAS